MVMVSYSTKRMFSAFVTAILLLSSMFIALSASAEEQGLNVTSDATVVEQLGLLAGDGNGVTSQYLSKNATRIQAAIISLRLNGLLEQAYDSAASDNFSDSTKVGKSNQAVLSYLKAHPELGWQGIGNGKFEPLAEISSQQLYKVLLETLGYRSGIDFEYAQTEAFAASKGLQQIAGTKVLTNAHIATALTESLSAVTSDGRTLFAALQANGVLPAGAMLPQGDQIALRSNAELGAYLADQEGRTLYFFTKDAENLNSCQGNCIKNWPLFYTDNLHIPATLNSDDFGAFTREDGTKQITYKGWPLYYFVKDSKDGDVLGEAVNNVWFVAKPDYTVMIGTSTELGNYLTDDYGRTLYYFDKDTPNTSVCAGKCIENWPVHSPNGIQLPSTLKSADFSQITGTNGLPQTTFKGYPLYYFIQDKNHGDIKGQDVNNVWFIIDPDKFSGTTASQAKTYHIDIKEFSFGNGSLTVEAGSKIVFTNYDDMQHSAVAVNGAFNVPLLDKGDSYTITIDKPGIYDYFCEPHKRFMTGQIIVK